MHSVTIVDAADSVYQAAQKMTERDIGSVLVSVNGAVCGIFTERDLLNKVVASGLSVYSTPVKQVMTRQVLTIDADASILEASRMLNDHDIRRLVVTEAGKIIGIATARDVAKNLAFHHLESVNRDRDYGRIAYYENK